MKLSDKKTRAGKKADVKKWLVRGMALFLAALMLLGAVVMILEMFRYPSAAHETDGYSVRVGLMYGSGVTVGFETQAPHGFTVYSVTSDNQFFPIGQVADTKVSVTCDSNLSKQSMTYSLSSSASAVGGYHLETEVGGGDAQSLVLQYSQLLSGMGYDVFPAYINGKNTIRIGQFGTAAEAEAAISLISSYTGAFLYVAAPTATAVSVINPSNDVIVFEYDGMGESEMGLAATQAGAETAYLMTPAKNTYSGIFEFSRYKGSTTEGVCLVNIVDIEEYTEGVLPWEIGNSWPLEVQKAFAVAVRTYALSNKDSHKEYGFDVCNGTCCQCYKGRNRTTDIVVAAVAQTKGLTLTYDGKLATTFYSSSVGGCTVSINEAWGTTLSYPYLRAVATPWEKYSDYLRGEWRAEYSSAELLARLNSKGYTTLSGGIASVKIAALAENSTYVYQLEITDIYGGTATIRRTDTIRSVLGLNSANFVVAKAGEQVTITDYMLASQVSGDGNITVDESGSTMDVPTQNDAMTSVSQSDYYTQIYDPSSISQGVHVMSGSSERILDFEESVSTVQSIGGETLVNLTNVAVITGDGAASFDMVSERNEYYDLLDDFYASYTPPETTTPTQGVSALEEFSDIVKVHRTVTAEGTPGSFVFIGRGWGHGVGMSQWGAKDLSDLGYNFKAILQAYYPGTELTDIVTGNSASDGTWGGNEANDTVQIPQETEETTAAAEETTADTTVTEIPLG